MNILSILSNNVLHHLFMYYSVYLFWKKNVFKLETKLIEWSNTCLFSTFGMLFLINTLDLKGDHLNLLGRLISDTIAKTFGKLIKGYSNSLVRHLPKCAIIAITYDVYNGDCMQWALRRFFFGSRVDFISSSPYI